MIFITFANPKILRIMKITRILLLLLISSTIFAQSKIDVDGFEVPTSIRVKDGKKKTKLTLNGFGNRSKMWIESYTQVLYLEDKSTDAEGILNANNTIATRLYINSTLVTRKKLVKSLEEGIANSYEGNMISIKDRVETLKGFFNSESSLITEGYVDFVYSEEDASLHVLINDEEIGVIEGEDFRKVVFGIWLGNNPVDGTLKKRLLGK